MSQFTKIAVATTLAATVLVTSIGSASAQQRRHKNNHARDIGLGVAGAIIGAAIIGSQRDRGPRYAPRRHVRDCWVEEQEVWSNRRGRYVIRSVEVCD